MSGYRVLPTDTAIASRNALLRDSSPRISEQARPARHHDATLEWFATAERVGGHVDLDASAHTQGAMRRRRGVPSATNLLCLAFLYGPGRMPLRLIAERAAALNIAHVSEPALLRRLLNASVWLEHVVNTLIIEQLQHKAGDATPNQHNALSLALGDLRPYDTEARQAEAAKRFFLEFTPWPEGLYNDAQVHWLLCVRWNFVAATIKDGPVIRANDDAQPQSALERTRTMAHLIAALLPSGV